MPRARRSTRSPSSSASAIPAARRSSGWRARAGPSRYRFPRPMLQELDRDGPHRYAFSFSGLKTAVLRAVRPTPGGAPVGARRADKADIARGFQDAAIDVLVAKTAHAVGGARLRRGDDRRRRRLQPRAGGAAARAAGGTGPGERSFPAAQHRQRGHDRRRRRAGGSRAASAAAGTSSRATTCRSPASRTPIPVSGSDA